jgi:predicted RND superfamily exporter protein
MSDDPWDKKPDDELGSLAQSARQASLKTARIMLFLAAGITLLQAGVAYTSSENLARQVIEEEKAKQGPFVTFDPVAVRHAEETVRKAIELVALGVGVLGVIFVVFGAVVGYAPLTCTVTGLVLYLGLQAFYAIGNPATLLHGLIWKVIIIVGLVKAIQAAAAYSRELKSGSA